MPRKDQYLRDVLLIRLQLKAGYSFNQQNHDRRKKGKLNPPVLFFRYHS